MIQDFGLHGNRENVSSKPPPRFRRSWLAAFWVLTIVLGYVFAAPFLDNINPQWVKCEVISAKGTFVGGGGLRGSSGSVAAVVINTRNCHTINLKNGVSSRNMERIAEHFTAGEIYEFKMGMLSRSSASAPWVILSITAHEYRDSTKVAT